MLRILGSFSLRGEGTVNFLIAKVLMTNLFYQSDLISMKELTLPHIQQILEWAKRFKDHGPKPYLKDKIVAQCFFEPSTRTRLSFESATLRLGGQVLGFAGDEGLSIKKGETLDDTMRMISAYADAIVIRHPREGSARIAAEVCDVPVINGGDGANQHPTQALIDLFTVQETQQKLDGLSIAIAGDLKYGRAAHSFIQALELFDVRLYLVSPDSLSLPDAICDRLKKHGVRFSFHNNLEDVIAKVDVLYMTRIQQERFAKTDDHSAKDNYVLKASQLEKAKPNLKVLHPLPRVHEIEIAVDQTPFAYYFQQAANGVFVREAILSLILNEKLS